MTNTQTQQTQRKSKTPYIFFGIFLVLIVSTVFLHIQNNRFLNQQKTTKTSIENTQKTIDTLSDAKSLEGFQKSAIILKKQQEERIQWSKIVPKILTLESNILTFSNFTIDPEKNIIINGETRSINNVSVLINTIKKDKELSEAFVSSIKINEEATGPYPVSFTINFESK